MVPAYNEEERLPASLRAVVDYLGERRRAAEVLVVDDGSTDGTAELVRSFAGQGVELVQMPANRGKGAALRRGVAASTGEKVLLTDADLSTPIAEVERLEPHLAAAELVLGSRGLPDSRIVVRQPLYRELMGRTFNFLIRLLGAARGFRDTQCGFKLLAGDPARRLFADLTIDRFAYDVELIWLARRRGLRVVEVGVTWANSPPSRVHPLFDASRMLFDVVRMRWRHRR